MKTLLLEMPWRHIDTECPNCNHHIEDYDYFIELWDKTKLNKSSIRKIVSKLMETQYVPIICPNCNIYFIYNINTKEKKIKQPPKIFKDNTQTIIDTYKQRSIPSFKSYYDEK